MEYLLNSVEVAKQLRLVIIDACRDNPFLIKPAAGSGSRSMGALSGAKGKGLARVEPQPGTLVVYSTKHGQVALDGNDSSHSPFTESLTKRILQKPPIEIRRLFDFVREDVFESTNKVQQPFSYGSLSAKEDFFFVKQ
jgi:uncharacterized caspase-like protein